jgi:hypothetical protein
MKINIRPGERNPTKGKFGQARNAYGMNRINSISNKVQNIEALLNKGL